MRQWIKKVLLSIAPNQVGDWLNERRNRHIQNFEKSIGLDVIAAQYTQSCGLQVQHGIFEGMKYIPEATGSVFVPKLLGSYEAEIHDEIRALIQRNHDVLVDIGCAEGYYAVGMAYAYPHLKVFAYDSDIRARNLCTEMARINAVDSRVTVGGTTTPVELDQRCGPKTLLICDVDGAETLILDPQKVPSLRFTDMVIEFHDYLDSSITPTLRARFEGTHELTIVASRDKNPDDYPELLFLSEGDRKKIIGEYRPAPQSWGIFRARQRS